MQIGGQRFRWDLTPSRSMIMINYLWYGIVIFRQVLLMTMMIDASQETTARGSPTRAIYNAAPLKPLKLGERRQNPA